MLQTIPLPGPTYGQADRCRIMAMILLYSSLSIPRVVEFKHKPYSKVISLNSLLRCLRMFLPQTFHQSYQIMLSILLLKICYQIKQGCF